MFVVIDHQWILYMLGTVINHLLKRIKYTLALWLFCHNCRLCIFVMYCCDISHINSWMLFIFCTVTLYYKHLMHVRSKFTPCPNMVHWAIFAVHVLNLHLLQISTDLSLCREYAFVKTCFFMWGGEYNTDIQGVGFLATLWWGPQFRDTWWEDHKITVILHQIPPFYSSFSKFVSWEAINPLLNTTNPV